MKKNYKVAKEIKKYPDNGYFGTHEMLSEKICSYTSKIGKKLVNKVNLVLIF